MSEEKKRFGWRQIGQTLALLLFLVILPGGSWYYLRTGLDYRKKALAELGDLGAIPDFECYTLQGDTLRTEDLEGKLVIVSFSLPGDEATRRVQGETLGKLHEQFDDRADVIFLQHQRDDSASDRLADFVTTYRLDDPEQCYFLTSGRPSFAELRGAYSLPQLAGEEDASSLLALADTSLTIRRFYDVRNGAELKRLVAHIAILLPRERESQPVLVREPEK